MTCCTVHNCASFLRCVSAYDRTYFVCFQMSWDTCCMIFLFAFSTDNLSFWPLDQDWGKTQWYFFPSKKPPTTFPFANALFLDDWCSQRKTYQYSNFISLYYGVTKIVLTWRQGLSKMLTKMWLQNIQYHSCQNHLALPLLQVPYFRDKWRDSTKTYQNVTS